MNFNVVSAMNVLSTKIQFSLLLLAAIASVISIGLGEVSAGSTATLASSPEFLQMLVKQKAEGRPKNWVLPNIVYSPVAIDIMLKLLSENLDSEALLKLESLYFLGTSLEEGSLFDFINYNAATFRGSDLLRLCVILRVDMADNAAADDAELQLILPIHNQNFLRWIEATRATMFHVNNMQEIEGWASLFGHFYSHQELPFTLDELNCIFYSSFNITHIFDFPVYGITGNGLKSSRTTFIGATPDGYAKYSPFVYYTAIPVAYVEIRRHQDYCYDICTIKLLEETLTLNIFVPKDNFSYLQCFPKMNSLDDFLDMPPLDLGGGMSGDVLVPEFTISLLSSELNLQTALEKLGVAIFQRDSRPRLFVGSSSNIWMNLMGLVEFFSSHEPSFVSEKHMEEFIYAVRKAFMFQLRFRSSTLAPAANDIIIIQGSVTDLDSARHHLRMQPA